MFRDLKPNGTLQLESYVQNFDQNVNYTHTLSWLILKNALEDVLTSSEFQRASKTSTNVFSQFSEGVMDPS